MEYFNAFLCGGILCLIGQLLIDKTPLTPAKILVLYVVTGVVLGGAGVYQKLVDWAGSGATVPLTGFGYLLAKGVRKAVEEQGFLGALTGGVTAAAGGITAAIFFGFLVALLFKGTLFRGEAVPFVMELPNYRMPGLKNVGQLLWDKAKDFLQRAFTVIFLATIVIWFLQTFDLHLRIVQDSQDSILALVASCIAPIFKPLGFGDWRISTALITGFIAKESVVSTLTVLVGDGITSLLTVGAAAPLLVFCLLYTPCVAAIASVRRELGGKWALSMVAMQCGIAWICACLMRTVLLLAGVA